MSASSPDHQAISAGQAVSGIARQSGNRFHTIDALRGFAALAVAIFHIYFAAMEDVRHMIPAWLDDIVSKGYVGVAAFFVISGFVIAASVGEATVNRRYIGKFALKRSVRLDPPYWLSIFLDIMLLALAARLFSTQAEMPGVAQVVSHFFYAQELLGYGSISDIYWTLCLEVQFYVYYVLILALLRRGDGSRIFTRNGHLTWPALIAFFGVGIYSIGIRCGLWRNLTPGLFTSHWCWYLLGVACYWCALTKDLKAVYFWAFATLMAVSIPIGIHNERAQYSESTALLTAIFIYFVTVKQKHQSWLNWRPLLWLGTISYSLYLFHAIIGERIIQLLKDEVLPRSVFGFVSTPADGLLLMAITFALVFLFCHLVYLVVEKPSMKISKRIKPNKPGPLLEPENR